MERRLAAVVAADMVGYSHLMELDETGTLARLQTHRIELIDPAIQKNHGRIIKSTGDGLLVEFQSVADAVGSISKDCDISTDIEVADIIGGRTFAEDGGAWLAHAAEPLPDRPLDGQVKRTVLRHQPAADIMLAVCLQNKLL